MVHRFVGSLVASTLLVTACSGGDEQPSAALETVDPSAAAASDPTTAADSPGTAAPTTAASLIDASASITVDGVIPESTGSEPSGNFRFICHYSHLAADDPIVFPGQPGVSHLHMFFGNVEADASSTAASLRSSGNSSCQGGPINRTAYWTPAVIDGDGQVRVPDHVLVYYKGNGPSAESIHSIRDLPEGLQMIAGHDPDRPDAPRRFDWYCELTQVKGDQPVDCPAGERLGVNLHFPSCWDGVNLDSADHRSHMAYADFDPDDPGVTVCPADHPVYLPELTIGVWFSDAEDGSTWRLSSDDAWDTAPGASFHADWIGAWDPTVAHDWVETCIRGMLNCFGGQLGDGRVLAGDWATYDGPYALPAP